MKENVGQIVDRLFALESLSVTVCAALTKASVAMEDEESAEHLFKKIREYVQITATMGYSADEYLEALEMLVELSRMIRGVPMLRELHNTLLDNYEVLLFNKVSLIKGLNEIKRQEQHSGLRKNYWSN